MELEKDSRKYPLLEIKTPIEIARFKYYLKILFKYKYYFINLTLQIESISFKLQGK